MEQPEPSLNSFLFFILLLLSGCATNENSNGPFVNRNQATARTSGGILYVNDVVFSGTLFSLAPNGIDTLEVQGYKEGREHGIWIQKYANGKIQSKRYFKRGKKEGRLEAWWENGNKRLEYHFKNGEYEGNCKEWAVNGMLIKSLNYVNGHEERGAQRKALWNYRSEIMCNTLER
jgi:antitoxin component YwqK of YwqJK toxin-antitoxin module